MILPHYEEIEDEKEENEKIDKWYYCIILKIA